MAKKKRNHATAAVVCCAGLVACGGEDTALAPTEAPSTNTPNVLLIIADDQGIDASSQYAVSADLPLTPNMDQLASSGLVFENAWATPSCTTTRGALITGQHGVNSGVDTTPDRLDETVQTLQRQLSEEAGYATAVLGKWHLAGGNATDADHPNASGIGYFAGNIAGTVSDYSDWELTVNGTTVDTTQYHTSAITDLAIDWLDDQQDQPWFLWMAYVAPHSPFHLPPADLHSRSLSGTAADIDDNKRDYYLAAVEALDTEVGRLVDSLDASVRDNTLIIYIGDNGTPSSVIDTAAYVRSQGKGSLYEGGLRVPMFASGAGVSRVGEREDALVNAVDLYATLTGVLDVPTPDGLDSVDISPLFSDASVTPRTHNYSEYVSDTVSGWAVRDESLKLIELADGTQSLFDLATDPREENDLIAQAASYGTRFTALEAAADAVRAPGDGSNPSTGAAIDITNVILTSGSGNCADFVDSYVSDVLDVNTNTVWNGDLTISVSGGNCTFDTNAIPNHDFNDADNFPNAIASQTQSYTVTATPSAAASPIALSLTVDNAILLNGVKVDLLAAGCFGVGDGKVGCNDPDQPWRFDPMFAANGFRVDSHNAHTQPDSTYHYHGPPEALYSVALGIASPVVGFAADGFPIFGSLFDDNGTVRAAAPSYRLRTGTRPNGADEPGGSYDGTYRDDYEYVSGLGDLDECNGMTVDGQYGYYMTDAFPYVIGCFTGEPDDSFIKR